MKGNLLMTLQPASIPPPSPSLTYFEVAESLMLGVKALALTPDAALALALVSGHALECLLKAYISRNGLDVGQNTVIRHNLKALWYMASAEGLQIPASPPSWVDRLSSLHNAPYELRYSTWVHGVVLPDAEPMTAELIRLLNVVRENIK